MYQDKLLNLWIYTLIFWEMSITYNNCTNSNNYTVICTLCTFKCRTSLISIDRCFNIFINLSQLLVFICKIHSYWHLQSQQIPFQLLPLLTEKKNTLLKSKNSPPKTISSKGWIVFTWFAQQSMQLQTGSLPAFVPEKWEMYFWGAVST